MSKKEDILSRYRANIKQQFDMPSLDDIKGITYPDPLVQFISISEGVGGKVVEQEPGVIPILSVRPRHLTTPMWE